jgi:hypothetical protein
MLVEWNDFHSMLSRIYTYAGTFLPGRLKVLLLKTILWFWSRRQLSPSVEELLSMPAEPASDESAATSESPTTESDGGKSSLRWRGFLQTQSDPITTS